MFLTSTHPWHQIPLDEFLEAFRWQRAARIYNVSPSSSAASPFPAGLPEAGLGLYLWNRLDEVNLDILSMGISGS